VATAKFFGAEIEIGKVTWWQTNKKQTDPETGQEKEDEIIQKFRVSVATYTVYEKISKECSTFSPINYGRPISITVYEIPFYLAKFTFTAILHPRLNVQAWPLFMGYPEGG
jgi:hypothetical protein